MAGLNKMELRMLGMAAVAAVMLMMMAVAVVARPAKLKDITCSTSDKYVYPYWSFCESPAELSTGYSYIGIVQGGGGLAPEYDETNATYYIRLSDSGATYVAVTESTNSDTLLVDSTVYIYNAESKRALTWRQEGSDEYFLIEQEVSSISEGAPFRFLQANGISLACPLIYPIPECQAYYLVSDLGASSTSGTSGSGLLAYVEESITYIKAAAEGSTGDLPILVIRGDSSTAAMPFPTIRSVTARE